MRTVTYSAACSLDGYIAGSDGSFDWLYFSPDVEELMGQYWSNVDAVLMGRKTWEFSAGQEFSSGAEADDTASAESPEGTDASKGAALTGDGGDAPDLSGIPPVTTYLFSRTLTEAPDGVELVSSDAGGFVNRLKQQPGKGIFLMGGGELAASLFEAGAIDVVSLNVHPVLLGSGVPFFGASRRRISLELTESRALDGGCVLMNYRVRN